MKDNKCFSLLICVVFMICCFAGCSAKKAQTVAGFTEFMESAGFKVEEVTDEVETEDLAKTVLLATSEDYQIAFYEFIEDETGEDIFNNIKSALEDEHSTKFMSSSISLDNYDYYAFTSNGDFHVVVRIGNTVIFSEADKAYKKEIVNYLKELGYK